MLVHPALEEDWDVEAEAASVPAPLASPPCPSPHPEWAYWWLLLLEHQLFHPLTLGPGTN